MATQNVIHLQLLDTDEHYYFGSTKALCEMFGKNVIGITYGTLCTYVTLHGFPIRTKTCIIRKGEFHTKCHSKKDTEQATNN